MKAYILTHQYFSACEKKTFLIQNLQTRYDHFTMSHCHDRYKVTLKDTKWTWARERRSYAWLNECKCLQCRTERSSSVAMGTLWKGDEILVQLSCENRWKAGTHLCMCTWAQDYDPGLRIHACGCICLQAPEVQRGEICHAGKLDTCTVSIYPLALCWAAIIGRNSKESRIDGKQDSEM